MKNFYFKLWCFLLCFMALAANLNAQRYVKPTASGTGDGSSWANASSDLQAMINASSVGGSVWVAAGTYKPAAYPTNCSGCNNNRYFTFQVKDGVSIYGGFAGTETSISERNILNNATVLSGDIGTLDAVSDNCYHVVYASPSSGGSLGITIDGFTIRDGFANTGNSLIDIGGGLFVSTNSLLRNNTFRSNYAAFSGGAVRYEGGTHTAVNNLFYGNSSSSYASVIGTTSTVYAFYNNTFANNIAFSAINGTTIYNAQSNCTLKNNIFWNNLKGTVPNVLGAVITNDNGTLNPIENCVLPPNSTPYANSSNIVSDPLLTWDYRLQVGSPAIDAGNNVFWTTTGLTTDLGGNPRPMNTVDIGAFEHSCAGFNNRIYVTQNGTGNGSSWADATGDLQAAINNTCGITEIWVAAGTYTPTEFPGLLISGNPTSRAKSFYLNRTLQIYGGFAGNETQLSQRNLAANTTILSGDIGVQGDDTDNCYHVFITANLTAAAVIDGFTVRDGNATDNNGGSLSYSGFSFNHLYGGGFYNANSSPTLTNVRVSNNSAATHGGGFYNQSSSPTLTNVIVSNNGATYGGGFYNISSSPTLTNVTISENSASIGSGFFNQSSFTTIVRNSILWNNNNNLVYNSGGNVTFSYSIVQGSGGSSAWTSNAINGGNNIDLDPVFTNAASGDFTLQSGSHALNMGNNALNTTTTDLAGGARVVFGTIDLGAYEHYCVPSIPVVSITSDAVNNSIFMGATVTFTAAPATSGTTTYQWKKNGNNVGTNMATYADATLANNDVISVEMTSNNPCALATNAVSNAITMTVASICTGTTSSRLYVKPTGTGDGSSWANAMNDLQAAINNTCGITEIWVAAGTYKPTQHPDATKIAAPRAKSFYLNQNFQIYGGFAGTETLLSQRNPTANPTILSGDIGVQGNNTDNCYHVFITANLTAAAVINGFTISDGNATDNSSITLSYSGLSFYNSYGGGFYNHSSSPTLTNLIVSGNSTEFGGGGFYNYSSSPTLTNVTVSNNSAIYNGGGFYNHSSAPTLTNVIISGNSANGNGGGIYNHNSSPTLTNITVWGNTANNGGGIRSETNSSPIIRNSIIWNNGSSSIFNTNNAVPVFSFSIIEGSGGSSAWVSSYGTNGGNNWSYDPLFTNAAGEDFTLQASSPAINSGNNTFNTTATDLAGNPRIIEYNIDKGAYEYCPAVTTDVSITSNDADNTITVGTSVTFTVTSVNGGYNPSYQWKKNGNNVGTNTPTYTTATLSNGDVITVVVTNSEPCASPAVATSNAITIAIPCQNVTNRLYVTPTGTGNGSSWANATNDLQVALSNTCGVTEIWVAAGTYTPTQYTDPTTTTDSRTKSFHLNQNLQLYGGFAGNETQLSQRNPAVNVTILSGDIGIQGDSTDNCYHVFIAQGLSSSTVIDGFTVKDGNAQNVSTPHTSYGGFWTYNYYGGGFYNNNTLHNLSNVIITKNTATDGGGVYNNSSSPTLTNLTITKNTATNGGGVYNSSSSPTLTNLTITKNTATNGGGVYNLSASPTLTNLIISGNTATNGGGVYSSSSSTPTLTNVTISGNMATDGGGIYNANNSVITVYNSIIWDNGSSEVYNYYNFYQANSATFYNSILKNGFYGYGIWSSGSLSAYPLFTDAANGDFTLQASSPAINTGNNAYNSTATDLAGNPRIKQGTIDMGAYEFAPIPCVSGTRLYVKEVSSGTGDGSSWANAIDDLQAAINNSCGITEIWVATGTYTPTQYPDPTTNADPRTKSFFLNQNFQIYGGFAGTETQLSQRNPAANPTILSGDIGTIGDSTDNCYHVFITANLTASAVINGFTIKGGNGWNLNSHIIYGGSWINYNAGGGIYNSSSSPTLSNLTISGNIASYGGGIYNDGSSPTLSNVTFTGNTAYYGGGISNNSSSPTLSNVTITGNTAYYGGGISNNGSSPTLSNVTITGNTANNGGGVYDNNSAATFTNLTISENTATNGGGIYCSNSISTFTNVTISGNTATLGGGSYSSNQSSPIIRNSIIWGNGNSEVYNHNYTETIDMGDGNFFTINYTSTSTFYYSIVKNSGGSNWNSSYGVNGGNNLDVNPLFTNATNSDFTLQASSPAINAGNNAFNAATTDLAGNARIQGGTIDMGAYESNITCTPVTPSVAIFSNYGNNIVVVGNPVTFTASPTNGGTTPTYQWKKNGSNVGTNAPTYTTTTLANGDIITVVMTSSEACASPTTATSNALTINVCTPVTPSVTIISNDADNSIITGTSVTFSATPTNGGTTPTYQWRKNGSNVGTNAPTYTTTTLANGDIITVIMASNASCSPATATSNAITMVVSAASNTRYVKHDATGANNGSSWADAYTDLQVAINASTAGNELWVAAGTYYPSQHPDATTSTDPRAKSFFLNQNLLIYGGFAGTETQLSQRNSATNITMLSGDIGVQGDNSDNCYHVLLTRGLNNTAVIDGLTIKNGKSNSFTSLYYSGAYFNNTYGGGISNNASSPTLKSIVISNNNAINLGGGIYNENASPIITNATISGNSVTNHGGGIANRVNSLPTLTNVIISSNTAANGGGIYNEGASASLINVTISGNTASNGGAIVNYQSPSTILTNVTISGNTATNGSSIYNHASAPIIRNSIIWANGNNTLQNVSSSTPTFSHSIIANSGGSSNWNSSYGTNGGNNLEVNPLFTNAATSDFTLQVGSPAINTGNNAFNTTTTDLAGNARVQFTTIDMGAYESNITCTPVTPSVAIISNDADNSIIAGTSVTFTATPTNGGSLPTYQWKKNGNNVGTNAATYTDAMLVNGDTVIVFMTSSETCASPTMAVSNEITMTVLGTCSGITNRIYVTPNGTGNGSSWANAMNDLQAAINNTCGATELWVAAGTYYPTQFPDTTKSADPRTKAFFLAKNMQLYGGFAGTETQLSQRNTATNVTTLSGDIGVQGDNSDNCYHVFLTAGFTYAITIDGFTVRDGNSIGFTTTSINYFGYTESQHGAGFVNKAILTLNNVIISDNNAFNSGGGILNSNHGTVMTNVVLRNNSATFGAGMFNNHGSATLTNVLINNNSASIAGGIYNSNSSPILTNVTISNNTGSGRGIYNTSNSSPIIRNSILWNTGGTEVANFSNSTPSFINSIVRGSGGSVAWLSSYGTNGGNNLDIDPLFTNAATNDFTLQVGSPAINTGNNAFNTTTTDLAGNVRIQFSTIDMGAYESSMICNPVTTTINQTICQGNSFTFGTSVYDTTGTYTDTLQTSQGCDSIVYLILTVVPNTINIASSVTNVTCKGEQNGNITLNVSGGGTPYTYWWADSTTTQNQNNLAKGIYRVTVTDNYGCTKSKNISIQEPSAIVINNLKQDISCNGSANGSVIATVTGGVSPYTYLWNNGSTNDSLTNLNKGTYQVTVTDNAGCQKVKATIIKEPAVLRIPNTAILPTVGAANGTIDINVTGGILPYTYQWNNGNTTDLLTNIAAGTYRVTVTDANGCQKTRRIDLLNAAPLRPTTNTPVTMPFDIQLYPNPAKTSFNIQFDDMDKGEIQVEVFTALGTQIYSTTTNLSLLNISTESWEAGFYYVRVMQGEQSQTFKMVVQP